MEDTSQWKHVRVRAIGRLDSQLTPDGNSVVTLTSVGEQYGPHSVQVDLSLVDSTPRCDLVEVFGDIVTSGSQPFILAKFINSLAGADLSLYRRAARIISDRFPRLQR